MFTIRALTLIRMLEVKNKKMQPRTEGQPRDLVKEVTLSYSGLPFCVLSNACFQDRYCIWKKALMRLCSTAYVLLRSTLRGY